ncbi:MAG: hypothetical protein ABW007_02190 [Chitinophagaceae bacterium]
MNLKGKINLSLMIGPAVAVPVPRAIIDALTSVEVKITTEGHSGFTLAFSFSSRSPLNNLLLLLANAGPVIRVIILATIKGSTTVLMDGTISEQQISADAQTGQTNLTINGTDLTGVMNLVDLTGFPYPCMPAEARVALIVARYAMFGIIPMVIPSVFFEVPIITESIPVQEGKDFEYITKLATDVGYVFYIDPGPVAGMNIAYWGPEIKVGIPQSPLNVNMDALTNVESLSFSFDGSKRVLPIVFIQNEETKVPIPIPIPDISPLNPPLGLVPAIPSNVKMMDNTANLKPVRAIALGLAEAAKTSEVVSGTGSLDVVRYGGILKARSLVSVRGAGEPFDGLYYVKSVTHKIQRGEYKQDFALTRNGLMSTIPKVPV